MKKKRTFWRVLLGILIGFAVIIGGFVTFLMLGKDAAINLMPEQISLDTLADGVYEGKYDGFRFSNTLNVTVKNHQITDIKVVQPQVFMKDEAVTELADRVTAQQCTDVDVVSGATADSKAFLKAVENALKVTPN